MLRKLLAKLIKSGKKPKPKANPKRAASNRKKKPAKSPKKKAVRSKSKPARKGKPSKKMAPAPQGDQVAEVVAFFRIPVVAVIKVTRGTLKVGDRIWIKGHTTDLKQTLTSMQVDHRPITEVKKGDEAGVKIANRARRGDRVYKI